MFGKIGLWQLVIVFGVFVVLFGHKKLPELGKTLGQGLRNFRRSMSETDAVDDAPSAAKRADAADRNGK